MTQITVTVDDQAVRAYLGALATQLPRRVGFAMNTTANDVQNAIRHTISGTRLTLRQPAFILKTIYRKPGEDFPDIRGGRLVAAVRVDDQRNFLAKHETGGVKVEEGGGLKAGGRILVPLVRQDEPRMIMRRNSPLHISRIPQGIFNPRGRPKGAKFYGVITKQGVPLIFQVTGRRGARKKRAVYALLARVPIRPVLKFHETAARTVDRQWPTNLSAELDEAIRRASA